MVPSIWYRSLLFFMYSHIWNILYLLICHTGFIILLFFTPWGTVISLSQSHCPAARNIHSTLKVYESLADNSAVKMHILHLFK